MPEPTTSTPTRTANSTSWWSEPKTFKIDGPEERGNFSLVEVLP